LNISLRKGDAKRQDVSTAELLRQLSAWHQEKTISEEEWRSWSSRIEVSWSFAAEVAR
jgi:hypothetical protein